MNFFVRALVLLACLASIDAAAARVLNTCTTISDPGPYVLGRNITANGDCFVVAADFVTVDLGGFVVSGNGTGSAFLEQLAVGRRGVTIRDGTITGFSSAVFMLNSGVTVERIQATGNSFNAISAGDTSTVRNCQVLGNGGAGVALGQRGLVTGSTINGNQGTGVNVGLGGSVI
ncbi:MAG TPA: right-handed parallel beta-helix repeat-containing protein, partial [Usitatibacter sp.]|nr:right-handed parallel beta-helix repeat-containing protein [Usitatibacter sp.]